MDKSTSLRLDRTAQKHLEDLSESLGTSKNNTIKIALEYLADARTSATGELRSQLAALADEHGKEGRLELVFEGKGVVRAYVAGEVVSLPAFADEAGDGQNRLCLGHRTDSSNRAPTLAAIVVGTLPRGSGAGAGVSQRLGDLLSEIAAR
jgi:hypothetical protein